MASEDSRLTARQVEILLHCVEQGYYEIPRRVTLRTMAANLGISAPSLSLVLRRAEAKLILDFAQSHGFTSPATNPDLRTIAK